MKKVLTKYQIKKLYDITKKEKYYFPLPTIELLKLTNVEYQEKLDYLDKEMKKCDLGIFKTAEFFSLEERKKNLLRDECWDLQWRIEHFNEELDKDMNTTYLIEIDDEDCNYIDELEEKN